ncbi:MAG: methylmalonyl-CoA epimerase [Candidatus Xenobium sp.]|jgi:methylmalonyl-CoA/ethylmalonyl-CoA epimerase
MITGVSHIAIAVRSLEETIPFYRDILGMTLEGIEVVPDQKVKVAFFLAGQTRIELLEATSEDSPISKFVAERGGGIHHLALRTEDVSAEIARMQEHQIRMIDSTPRGGAHHTRIAFIHPKAAHGVLLELTEESSEN